MMSSHHIPHAPLAAREPSSLHSPSAPLLQRAQQHLADRHGLLFERLGPDFPVRGIFDGKTISLREGVTVQDAFFLTVHVFGHAVQFGTSSAARVLAGSAFRARNNPDFERAVFAYETEASSYGAQLILELDATPLLPWYEQLAHADRASIIDYCRIGCAPSPTAPGTSACCPFIPQPIPSFTPQIIRPIPIL